MQKLKSLEATLCTPRNLHTGSQVRWWENKTLQLMVTRNNIQLQLNYSSIQKVCCRKDWWGRGGYWIQFTKTDLGFDNHQATLSISVHTPSFAISVRKELEAKSLFCMESQFTTSWTLHPLYNNCHRTEPENSYVDYYAFSPIQFQKFQTKF